MSSLPNTLLLIGALANVADPTPADDAGAWGLEARPFGESRETGEQSVWVGLTNRDAVELEFCRPGVGSQWEMSDGSGAAQPSEEYPFIGCTHEQPCGELERTLVLPGQTHFLAVRLRRPPGVTEAQVSVWFLARRACLGAKCADLRRVYLTAAWPEKDAQERRKTGGSTIHRE